ncbi:MAG TPA: hypothetical protein VNS52_15035 [Gemmatimonadaceae bacterium]|nr:hypothetical protein [Gemmatimonadaceae bacterium]
MANVELHLNEIAAIALVQSRFRRGDRGEGSTLTVGAKQYLVSTVDVVADTAMHADEPDTDWIRNFNYLQQDWVADLVTTRKVIFTQGLQVSLQETVTDASGTPQLQAAGTYTVHVRLRMNAWLDADGTPLLVTSVVGVTADAPDPDPDPELTKALVALAQGKFPAVTSPIRLYGNVTYANAGVMASADHSRVVVRLELGKGTQFSVNHWQSFHDGNVPDRLHVDGVLHLWSVFVDASLVVLQVQDTTWRRLNKHADKLRLVGGVSATWAPQGTSPELDVSFYADAIDACVGLGDMNMHVTSHTVLVVPTDATGNPKPNTLQSLTHFDWDLNDLDVAKCAILFGVSGGIVGGVVGGIFFGPGGLIVGAIAGFAAGVFVVLGVTTFYEPTLNLPNCTQTTAHDMVCEEKLPVTLSSQGGLPPVQVTQVFGLADGLLLSGTVDIGALTTSAVPKVALSTQDFRWQAPTVSCGSAGAGALAFLLEHLDEMSAAVAVITLTNTGSGSLVLRGVDLLSADPAGVFAGHIFTYQYLNYAAIEIRSPYDATYAANPYPCRLLVRTNGGNAVVTLGPIPALDDAARNRLEGAVVAAIGDCFMPVDDWWAKFRRFNPLWHVDPPPGGRVDRWRMVEVQGIPEGAGVQLEEGEGRVVGVARADASGVARLGIVTGDQDGELALVRRRDGDAERGTAAAAPGVRIVSRQVELVPRSRLELGGDSGRAIALGTTMIGGQPHLFALAGGTLRLYDLSNAERPVMVRSFAADGARAFAVSGGYVAVAGDSGLTVYAAEEGRALWRRAGRLTAIAVFGDAVVAVDGERAIAVSLDDRSPIEVEPIEGAHTVAATSRHVVVGTPTGLHAFRSDDGGTLRKAGFLEMEGVADVCALPGLHPRTAVVAVHRDGRAAVVDFADAARPRVLATYERVPRFARVARVGSVVAEPVDGGAIAIGGIGRNVLV